MDSVIKQDINRMASDIKQFKDKYKGKTVLITGGSGFLGSYLCDLFIKVGCKVICVDNLSSGLAVNVSHLLKHSRFKFKKHNIREPFKIREKIDLIFHLASMNAPGEFREKGIEIAMTNTQGSYNVLMLAKEKNASILLTSTSEIYGNPAIVPTPETYHGDIDPLGIRSSYDESKRVEEVLGMDFFRKYDLPVKIIRIFNSYGPRQRYGHVHGKVLMNFLYTAMTKNNIEVYGTGKQTRTFTYVTDTLTGLLYVMFSEDTSGKAFNVGQNQETEIIQLAKTIKRELKNKPVLEHHELPESEPVRRCPEIAKIKEFTGWKPKINVADGIKWTRSWLGRELKKNS